MKKVDFSKMTPEKYKKILETREKINNLKKELSLEILEISAFKNEEGFGSLYEGYLEQLKKVEEYSKELEPYEI